MSISLTNLAPHQLNTSGLRSLAEDIVSRIDINIICTYYIDRWFLRNMKLNGEEGTKEYCRLIKDPSLRTYYLSDETYMEKQYYRTFGEEAFIRPRFGIRRPELLDMSHEKRIRALTAYYLYYEEEDDYQWIDIYAPYLSNHFPEFFPNQYFLLTNLFIEPGFMEKHKDYVNHFQTYRRDMMQYTLAFGGDRVYYTHDHGGVYGLMPGEKTHMKWPEIEDFIRRKSDDLLLDLPRWFTDPDYRRYWLRMARDPKALFDDFRDLKNFNTH